MVSVEVIDVFPGPFSSAFHDTETNFDRWLSYDIPEHLQHTFWQGHYKGQRQQWLICRFKGQDTEINLQTAHPEFSHWRWTPVQHIADTVIPFKKNVYLELQAYLQNQIND